jgi:hypothetical protein
MAVGSMLRARRMLTWVLAAYGLYYVFVPGHYGLFDYVDLGIHETGHLVFGPFGEFIGMAGGTMLQLIFPLAFVWYFWRERDRHAATVAGWWVAQNLWNIAVYVQDAQAEELPLVGGGEHDWAYLLGKVGLIDHDHVIGQLVRFTGVLVFAYSTMRGLTYTRPQPSTDA